MFSEEEVSIFSLLQGVPLGGEMAMSDTWMSKMSDIEFSPFFEPGKGSKWKQFRE